MHSRELQGVGMTSQRTRDRLVDRLASAGIEHEGVLTTLRREPRHLFLDEALSHRAYEDVALPIGNGQTLSQPWVVARMTELLLVAEPRRVLEIGTGSGYQTLILSRLVDQLWSIERIRSLHKQAAERLKRLKATNLRLRQGDGNEGWPEAAPFDAILVTAACREIPPALLDQLDEGGTLVVPLEDKQGEQWLTRVRRRGDGFRYERFESVRFVPLLEGVVR
ncbi:protein-L-isoaspartate(D-aspartate) O-methyltransferase [Pistricoccus aurantiacus]|uniref:Protein-L-isoaspartate O-methyltransferase n=2 Tax=Pistricoccus aurantiacus TaxID=1883414 RepID=A0A5B8SRH3_9GAMM|nr:protein-L-isoaspartate(D-aspartate) O-methyltransferase [Pistricoccus aurantiacus]